MFVYWTQDLAVGVELIDDQHKELFNQINLLLEACESGQNIDGVEQDLIGFMKEYILTHFADEEALMSRHGYPAFQEHQQEHNKFKESLNDLINKIDQDSGSKKLLTEFNNVVIDLLTDHIQSVDRLFGKFIASRNKTVGMRP